MSESVDDKNSESLNTIPFSEVSTSDILKAVAPVSFAKSSPEDALSGPIISDDKTPESSELTIKLESTESVRELLTTEEIDAFAQLSIKEVQAGRPALDGEGELGATHSYTHESGAKVATYTLFNPIFRDKFGESEWTVFVGLEEEIQMLLAEFEAFNNRLLQPIVNDKPKLGRNDPCHCGSKKKYKKCCLQ